MNLISSPSGQPDAEAMITSLQNWWSLAGVDLDYTDQPTALLAEKAPPQKTEPVAQAAVTAPPPAAVSKSIPDVPLPASYDQFIAWLGERENLLEGGWSRHLVLPQGVLEPEIMTISALPEKNDGGSAALFNRANQKLLDKMLAALGCDSERLYRATIAIAPSVDGRIEDQYWPTLHKRMLHHIGLVKPKRIICFGDLAAKIIFGDDLLTARKNKQFINHESAKTETIVTFHPRILIERPLFKAEAWKDLQMLTRISVS